MSGGIEAMHVEEALELAKKLNPGKSLDGVTVNEWTEASARATETKREAEEFFKRVSAQGLHETVRKFSKSREAIIQEQDSINREQSELLDAIAKGPSEAEALADAHWSYIESLLKVHRTGSEALAEIGFHYKSAMIHGFKHGVESERARMLETEEVICR